MAIEIHPELLDDVADERLVEIVAEAMTEKLDQKRREGRGGWHTHRCTTEQLRELLREHLGKGDMVDVLNFAGMILARERAGL